RSTRDWSSDVCSSDLASSDAFRIRVVEMPRLKSIAATLRFPKYTGFPEKSQETGHIDAIEGTEVTLEGRATRPLRSAIVASSGRSEERRGGRARETRT